MTTAELAFKLIRVFEGFRSKAYKDSGGVWTIGLGHTKDVQEGMVCTYEQAIQWFEEDAAPLLKLVTEFPTLQAAAYVSFGYNCGLVAMRRLLNGTLKFEDRIRDRNGTVLAGLVARRELEKALVEASKP